jgi:hypothetical protein
MADARFDALVRRCAAGLTRRGAVRLTAAGLLGSILGTHRVAEVAAACRLVDAPCSRKRKCCSGARCVRSASGRTCVCKPGRVDCDGDLRCETDTQTDPNNCGSCGRICASGTCIRGNCVCTISTQCPGTCACTPRRQGGSICVKGGSNSACLPTGTECTKDSQCPLGQVCVAPCSEGQPSRCADPCTD